MATMSKLPVSVYRYKNATSISSEPKKVYKKNLTAAYTRRSPPQMPITKNSGISVASQKT